MRPKSTLRVPRLIEQKTLAHWLASGAVTVTYIGEENTYAVTEFGQEVYAKTNH